MLSLDDLWEDLEKRLLDRFLVYPAVPPVDEARMSYSVLRQAPHAPWPNDRSLDDYLDFASELGVRIIYAIAQRFGQQDVETLRMAAPSAIPGADAFVEEATSTWTGHVHTIHLMWVYEGIAHHWHEQADWLQQLRQQAQELQQRGAPVVMAEHFAEVEELARKLAAESKFQRIPTVKKRVEAARLWPELREVMRNKRFNYRFAEDVAQEAWRIYQDEIVPAEEAELARRGSEFMAGGMTKAETAGRLGISPDRLTRILARYPKDGQSDGPD